MYCNASTLYQLHSAQSHLRHLWLWLPVLATSTALSLLLLAVPLVTMH
ncbi:hypothetical protein [uncultured Thiodictyon sp.]|nr:hypothetical protein [uncultured Thiodictyon sp.]